MFVGGSVGQGTTIQGHYDLDLVIFSRSKNYVHATTSYNSCNGSNFMVDTVQVYDLGRWLKLAMKTL